LDFKENKDLKGFKDHEVPLDFKAKSVPLVPKEIEDLKGLLENVDLKDFRVIKVELDYEESVDYKDFRGIVVLKVSKV
jgi:hypothetical protein